MWKVEYLDNVAEAEVENLPKEARASFLRIGEMIRSNGLERMREPYVKHLEGKLWEMRLTGRDGIARSLYVTVTGKRVVVVHSFVKKTQKTPRRVIDYALKRAKEAK
jgi:phage-related protein